VRAFDGRHEAVTLARYIRDVARASLAVSKAPTQVGHLDSQVTGFDYQTAPGTRDQLPLIDDLACPLDQGNKDIQSPTTQHDGYSTLVQDPCSRKEVERSERDGFRGRTAQCGSHRITPVFGRAEVLAYPPCGSPRSWH